MVTRLGILTGGGDCPGLNAAIRAIVRRADQHNIQTFGFEHGWQGTPLGPGGTNDSENDVAPAPGRQ